jgi:hypothetical protein
MKKILIFFIVVFAVGITKYLISTTYNVNDYDTPQLKDDREMVIESAPRTEWEKKVDRDFKPVTQQIDPQSGWSSDPNW